MKTVAVVGAGGVGSHALKALAPFAKRAGIAVDVIDRDVVDETGLARSAFFRKETEGRPKAEAASEWLASQGVKPSAFVEHLDSTNIGSLVGGACAVLDCTDNWLTRALLNDYCLRERKPWIFSAAVRDDVMLSTIMPGKTPCWLCWNPKRVSPRSCAVEGITKRACELAGGSQALELKRLLKGKPALAGKLFYKDAGSRAQVILPLKKRVGCPACKGVYQFLNSRNERPVVLCGDNEFLFKNRVAGNKGKPFLEAKTAKKVKALGGTAVVLPSGSVITKGVKLAQARELNELAKTN